MPEHKQVKISHGNNEAEVDEGIADLILGIWKAGIDTVNSCQENQPGIVWISFMTVEDGCKFLSIVAGQFPKAKRTWKTLYGRVLQFGSESDWQYKVNPMDLNAMGILENDEIVYDVFGRAEVFFNLSVRFPIADVPKATLALEKFNPRT